LVAGPVVILLAISAMANPSSILNPTLLFWASAVATVDLMAVPVSTALQLSLSFPILLGVAILYPPSVAASVAFVGSFDPRELKREIAPITALFNRSQIALAVFVQSSCFHALASYNSRIYVLVPSVLVAYTAAYSFNVTLVALDMHFSHALPIRVVLAQMRLGALREFLLNVLGLSFIGVIIVRLYVSVQLWSVAAFILPLVFARQMFFRSMALEEAGKELKDRERVMRALSNRMAEERQDERMQIAGYLHDDLAQMLFRLSLQVDMAKKQLSRGEADATLRHLEGITGTHRETSDMVRALIRDLHRSPIGRKGLGEAIQSFAEDMTKGLPTRVSVDVVEVSLPPPIQLLIYQITREAVMHALKHAEAAHILVSLQEKDDGVELQIKDDGNGFDTSAPPPEGHFGSVMMRERAVITGGTFKVDSAIGAGTTISATFPRVWIEEGTQLEADQEAGASAIARSAPVGSTGPPRPREEPHEGSAAKVPRAFEQEVADPNPIRAQELEKPPEPAPALATRSELPSGSSHPVHQESKTRRSA